MLSSRAFTQRDGYRLRLQTARSGYSHRPYTALPIAGGAPPKKPIIHEFRLREKIVEPRKPSPFPAARKAANKRYREKMPGAPKRTPGQVHKTPWNLPWYGRNGVRRAAR